MNNHIAQFARSLSPSQQEREKIGEIYAILNDYLSEYSCIRIGSYPRYTAVRPVHDLDILCCIGEWGEGEHNPASAIEEIYNIVECYQRARHELPNIKNLTKQKHSVCIEFEEANIPSIDIIPCYKTDKKNEFDESIYIVPEIAKTDKKNRNSEADNWIKSDPKGYISLATKVDEETKGIFRKTTKIVKYWKTTFREKTGIKLKSFHLEQAILRYCDGHLGQDLLETIVNVFRVVISDAISSPNQIEDRAQAGVYIDDYVKDLKDEEKDKINTSLRHVLDNLENGKDMREVFSADISEIPTNEEFIISDYGFLPCCEDNILAKIRCDNYPSRKAKTKVDDTKLYFKLENSKKTGLRYFWKVKNSESLPLNLRRGEINEGSTKNDPEAKKYNGCHEVACYAVNEKNEIISKDIYEVEFYGGDNE